MRTQQGNRSIGSGEVKSFRHFTLKDFLEETIGTTVALQHVYSTRTCKMFIFSFDLLELAR